MIRYATPDGGRALFWACVLACCLAAVIALAARAAQTSVMLEAFAGRGVMTARVIAPDVPTATEQAAEALRAAPGVRSAEPVTPARAAALINRWTQGGLTPDDLAGLRLIELDADPGLAADPTFAARLEAALEAGGIIVEITAPPAPQGPPPGAAAARRLVQIAGFAAIAAGAIIFLIAWARAGARRAAIATMADLGATPGQAGAAYAGEAAMSAFAAGVVGAVLAAGVSALILPQFVGGLTVVQMLSLASPLDMAPLAATPPAAALLAALGARAGAQAAYASRDLVRK